MSVAGVRGSRHLVNRVGFTLEKLNGNLCLEVSYVMFDFPVALTTPIKIDHPGTIKHSDIKQ